MRGVAYVAAAAVAALAAGCATRVDVTFDESQDFSQYRTWDFLPRGRHVDALPGEEEEFDTLTWYLVDRALRGRGLVRDSEAPDLLVSYQLRVVRRLVVANETGATDYLASHHSSPSYLVQSTSTRIEHHDYGSLDLVVTNGLRDRVVWRGRGLGQGPGLFEYRLDDVITALIERFPAGSPGAAATAEASADTRENR
jgi:hypothetical protein